MKKTALQFIKAIPHAYATVMFSESLGVGLALMLLTMAVPLVGAAGLFALCVALLGSRLLGFEGWESASGVMAFNSLLVGLTLGYYYPLQQMLDNPLPFLALTALAALFTMFLYAGLNSLTQSWFGMPSMSLAFSIGATLLWYYLVRSGLFAGSGFQKPVLWQMPLRLHWYWQEYFLSMANIVFTTELWVGILVALLLLFVSRIGFMLSLLGWSVCAILMRFSDMGDSYGMFFPGFNIILISLCLGSVFFISSKSSYFIAILGSFAGFLVAYALSARYTFAVDIAGRQQVLWVPMFALPMNIVVIVSVYALRLRPKQSSPILNDYGILHPEQALDAYLSRYKRFSQVGVPQLMLPVKGEWIITQAHSGKYTHKDQWAFAWDFEMQDFEGKKYSEDENELKDYYCYGKPVLAAAGGYLAKLVNWIPDNPIGSINTHDNWGNYIAINHGYGFFTFYAHLKEGSIKHKEGDWIKQGEKIALVGSSGRSPVPHLHFNAQSGAEAGSPTLFSHLVNYRVKQSDGSYKLMSSGVADEDDQISSFDPKENLTAILKLGLNQEQSFKVECEGESWIENWKVDIDLLGVHRLVSDRGCSLEYSIFSGIFNALGFKGNKRSALSAFALAASRFAWAEDQILFWEDEPALSLLLGKVGKNLALFLFPLFRPLRAGYRASLNATTEKLSLSSMISLKGIGMKLREYRAFVELHPREGLKLIELYEKGEKYLSASRITDADTKDTV